MRILLAALLLPLCSCGILGARAGDLAAQWQAEMQAYQDKTTADRQAFFADQATQQAEFEAEQQRLLADLGEGVINAEVYADEMLKLATTTGEANKEAVKAELQAEVDAAKDLAMGAKNAVVAFVAGVKEDVKDLKDQVTEDLKEIGANVTEQAAGTLGFGPLVDLVAVMLAGFGLGRKKKTVVVTQPPTPVVVVPPPVT